MASERLVFVNLPVRDLERSMRFFRALGFEFNPQFTDEKAACMVLSDKGYVMLLTEPFFATFTTKKVADASSTTECTVAISATSREEVDALVGKALELEASEVGEARDYGFMYQRSFYDLDGHLWEVLYMQPGA
ncbi:MAG: VOC family protein [Pseudomonadota bacterium]|nr:MAG: glyoxalase/bleomycin resistance/extradiol dioxygenase family protein [Pseudomonadota bacterium]